MGSADEVGWPLPGKNMRLPAARLVNARKMLARTGIAAEA
jgi:hypothetical protein